MYILPYFKVLMPSLKFNSDGTITCDFADLKKIFAMILRFVPFDQEWYLDHNPDVQQEIGKGNGLTARGHYQMSGYFEGRMPFEPPVDQNWYLEAYPDVRESIARGEISDALSHFLGSGYREGRLPCLPAIDAKWYGSEYPDAKAAIENGKAADYKSHFLSTGYFRGYFPYKLKA